MQRLIALLLMADGISTSLGGHQFLLWLKTWLPRPFFHPFLNFFLSWPESLLRIGAMLQALVGWRLLSSANATAKLPQKSS